MASNVALQIYGVKQEFLEDAGKTLERIAEMGYSRVEICRWYLKDVPATARLLRSCGLESPSMHIAIEQAGADQIVDDALELGAKYVFTGMGDEPFSSISEIKKTARYFSEIADETAGRGVFLGIHNHFGEMRIIEGVPAYRRFLDDCSDNVVWQTDVFWAQVAGLNPVEVIKDTGMRCPSVHLKDGIIMGTKKNLLQPLGEGVMDIPAILEAAEGRALVVEQDGGNLADAGKSLRYLEGVL